MSRPRFRLLPASLAALAVVGLAGCGAGEKDAPASVDKKTSDADADAAATRVDEARTPPSEFTPAGPAFDASAADGMEVIYIANGLAVPFVKSLSEATTEGLESAGVDVTVLDGNNDIAATTRLIEQAVSQGVDAIITNSVPSDAIAEPLRAADEAGVKVIQAFETDPGPLPDAAEAVGVDAQATFCTACAGTMMADWVIADSKGIGQALTITNSGIGLSDAQVDAITATFSDSCGGCGAEVEDVQTPANWANRLPTLTRSSMTANRDLGYFLPIYDDMATFIVPEVLSAGAGDRVKVATFNGNTAFLEMIEEEQVVAADVAVSTAWTGWAFADQALRVLTGQEPLDDLGIPLLLVDATNVGDLDLSAPPETWFAVDFRAGYTELWAGGE